MSTVQAENVEDVIATDFLFFIERFLLLFGHVLEERNAPRVKCTSVRKFFVFTQLFADSSDFVEED